MPADDFRSLHFDYLLRLGDNALILCQRLGEWAGHGPVLEEDIALTNIALDLIGQSRLWLSYAGEIEGQGRDENALAFFRGAGEFRNVLLVEQPNGDYADTIARQFYFDLWHYLLLEQLQQSVDQRIRDIAEKALKEVTYHARRSIDWVVRLGDGTPESHQRIQRAVDEFWIFTNELFAPDSVDEALLAAGIAADLSALQAPWRSEVTRVLSQATLKMPESSWMREGGKRGVHSEHMDYLLAEMQALPRAHPGAIW